MNLPIQEVIGLIAIAIMKPEQREKLDERDFDTLEEIVTEIKSKPVPALRKVLLNKMAWEWNGTDPLLDFLAERLRCECLCERANRLFSKKSRDVMLAWEYLDNFHRMSNWRHEPESEVMNRVRECREILIGTNV